MACKMVSSYILGQNCEDAYQWGDGLSLAVSLPTTTLSAVSSSKEARHDVGQPLSYSCRP